MGEDERESRGKRGRGKEREREEKQKRKGEREERREKGKEEEGCNYGIVHNLGCSEETLKLQLSRVQSQSWAWKLMAQNFSDFLVI